MKSALYLLAILSLLFFSQCDTTDDNFTIDYKYEYFPVDSGHFVIYDIDSFFFDDFTMTVDTSEFQIMEKIESIFLDNEGRETQRVERFRREDTTDNWRLIDVWFFNRTINTAERVEENLRFQNVLFPPRLEQQWEGNKFIQITSNLDFLEGWTYELTELDVPRTINGITFDSTLTILQNDEENLLDKVFATETYARNVGLVYKELVALEKQDVTVPFPEGAEKGFIFRMQVADYGPK